MAVTEGDRAQLVSKLRGVIGEQETETLMTHLPHGGAEELATKESVRSEVETLRGEFGELRGEFAELRGDFGELRGEFGALRGEFMGLRGELGELRMEMRSGFAELRAEMRAMGQELRADFRGEIMGAVTSQTRLVFFAMVGTMLSIAALAFTLSRI